MARPFPRAARVASLLKEEIISILAREVRDPRVGLVTVSKVDVKGDLDHAVVWASVIGAEAERRETMKALEHAAPFIRRELSARLRLRQVPTLSFRLDTRMEDGARIQELLDAWHGEHPPVALQAEEALQRIAEVVRAGTRFLLLTHLAPDGDSLGSALAMRLVLGRMDKEALVVSRDVVPQRYRFLPGAETIVHDLPTNGDGKSIDAVLTFECPDVGRTGWPDVAERHLVVNVDHHEDNALFGRINWVEPAAPAVGEMVTRLLRHLGQEVDRDVATCVYTALMTDTGSFTYSNASAATLRLGAELVDRGADPYRIALEVYDSNRFERLKLLGAALERLQWDPSGRLAWMRVGRDDLDRFHALPEDMDDLVNYPRSVRGVDIAAIFKEMEPGKFRVSLRSKGAIDVFRIARAFQGGGHRNAAGCSIEGTYEEVRDRVLARCREVLEGAGAASA
jgi:phosphoesterase RecJ-like protein